MSYQFARIELFSRKGKAGRSVGFVLDEVKRVPSASLHVAVPGVPILVHGLDIDRLRELHDERASAARTEVQGGKVRAIRQDQNTLAGLVLSHPALMAEYRDSLQVRQNYAAWEARSVAWLRDQYGDQLVTVVRHEDESHPHLHAYLLPSDPELKAATLHPGFPAKAFVRAAGALDGEDEKALSKRADKAYVEAMRSWLDDYHARVAMPSGLTRIGPGRRHLTRAQWHEEKRQAAALIEVRARAEVVRAQGAAFIDRTKDRAASIEAEAARKVDAALLAVGTAKAADAKAQEAQIRARRDLDQARRATAMARRLTGIGGAIRGLWDGLRKSSIVARVRAEIAPQLERWQSAISSADARAAAAERRRLDLEADAVAARRSVAEIAAQRDDLRRRLDAYEPAAKDRPASAGLRRPY